MSKSCWEVLGKRRFSIVFGGKCRIGVCEIVAVARLASARHSGSRT